MDNPNLTDRERILIEEEQYRKQRFWNSYSIKGADYEPKYDTGKPISKTERVKNE